MSRHFSLAVLASVYAIAFVLSPYWILTRSPLVMAALLAVILILGAVWCFCAAGDVNLHLRLESGLYLAVVCVGVFILNYRTLTSVIPWRGDESIHIGRVLDLARKTPLSGILYFTTLFAATLVAAWRRSRWAIVFGMLLTASAIVFGTQGGVFVRQDRWIVRYPLFNYWIFMLLPKLAAPAFGLYGEILYRIVPPLAMAGVAWSFQRALVDSDGLLRFLWALSAATLPVIFYYSSILYIEPMAVWLMFIVCLHIRDLLRRDPGEVQEMPAWYALVLIGFIKETTLPFLLLFAICRLIVQGLSNARASGPAEPATQSEDAAPRRPWSRLLIGEARVIYATCYPIGLFFVLRSMLANVRSFDPVAASFLNPAVFRAIGQSFLEQFGPILIPSAVGIILLARRRDYSSLFFLCAVLVALPLITALDGGGVYAGYSRLNLLVLPPVLVSASLGLKHIVRGRRSAGPVAACALIITNILLSPIQADGTKRPFWGNYLLDTSEHYYPYRDALAWIKRNAGTKRILFAGLDYGYPFYFYFDQLHWHPRYEVRGTMLPSDYAGEFELFFDAFDWHPHRRLDQLLLPGGAPSESAGLLKTLNYANEGRFRVVVYQVLGKEVPGVRDGSGFRLETIIRNDAHTLMVFDRAE